MKTFKTSLIFLFLLVTFNLKLCAFNLDIKNNASLKTESIFKAQVFLDNCDYKDKNKFDKIFERIALVEEINTAIINKKTVIASLSLFKDLIKSRYYEKTLKKLFFDKQSNWNIFGTKDKNFIIFISACEHPEIKKRVDLEKVGLDCNKIFTLRAYNKPVITENMKKLSVNQSEPKNIDLKYLRDKFFLEEKLDKIQLINVQI